MLKLKLPLLLFSIFLLKVITAQTTFNKKFFIGAGGQLSVYNVEQTYLDITKQKINLKNYYTSYGVGFEFGYFVLPNLSVSFKSVLQEWSNTNNYGSYSIKNVVNSFHNGILFNKLFPLKNNIFFSVGAMPFYEKIFYTPSIIAGFNLEKTEARVNHGAVFNIGFAFPVAQNSILNVGIYRKLDALQFYEERTKSGVLVSYNYVFNQDKTQTNENKENDAYEAPKNKFSLVVGANINNPHQLLDGSASYTDYSSFGKGNGKSYGNLFLGLLYKNKWQLNLCQENTSYNGGIYLGVDYFLNARYYVLNDSFTINPYLEVGTIIGTITDDINSQKSVQYSTGFVYKLNSVIGLDFGVNLLYRELDLSFKSPGSSVRDMDASYNRFMVKTGLIFKIL